MFTPYFNLVNTLTIGSVTPVAAAGDGAGYVYTYDNGNTLRKVDLVNACMTSTTVTPSLANIGGMVMVGAASALMASTSSTNLELINVSTGQKTTISGGTGSLWAGYKAQQFAKVGDTVLITNNGARITKYTVSTQAVSNLAPGWITGISIASVIGKPDTGQFIVGTTTGTVKVIDSSGTQISSITLPTTPNDGTAPTHIVVNLCYFNDILVAATQAGFVFVYQLSTGTLLSRGFGNTNSSTTGSGGFGSSGGGGGLTMCEAPSGVLILGSACDNTSSGSTFQPIFLGSISASGFDIEDYYTVGSTGQKVLNTGVDHTYDLGWSIFRGNSAGHFQIFTIPSGTTTGVDFRTQYPLGTDVAYRNIIVKYNGPGRTRVIDDRNMVAGTTTLQLRRNARYIGISINGSNYDFRGIET